MSAPRRFSTLELIRWIAMAQRRAGHERMRARGLTPEQGFVLGHLVQHPGAIQREIAVATRTSAASVTSLLQGLQRRGLIERRTEDGDERSKKVYATRSGTELIAGLGEAMHAADETILAALDPAERAALDALVRKITDALPAPGTGRPADQETETRRP